METEILYSGHMITSDGILPDPEKNWVLQNYPVHTTTDEVKRFVVFANYYRKYIPNFAEKALPLNRLSRKNVTFEWTAECRKSFLCLRGALIKSSVL